MALGIGGELAPGAVDHDLLADAGEHVGERPPVGMVIEHVVDRDQRHLRFARQRREAREPRAVAPAIEHAGGKADAAGSGSAELGKRFSYPLPWWERVASRICGEPGEGVLSFCIVSPSPGAP